MTYFVMYIYIILSCVGSKLMFNALNLQLVRISCACSAVMKNQKSKQVYFFNHSSHFLWPIN